MASELTIPPVSWDQLEAFRHRHFSPAAQASFFTHFTPGSSNTTTTGTTTEHTPPPTASQQDEGEHYEEDMDYAYAAEAYECEDEQAEHEEEDNLGYYPDGVKRTLTDAQIAIFRHSEIQEMLKAKRKELLAAADAKEADEAAAEEEALASTNITEDYSTHDSRSRPAVQTETGALPWDDEDVCAWEDNQQQQQLTQQTNESAMGKGKEKEVPAEVRKPVVKPTFDAPSGREFFWPVIRK